MKKCITMILLCCVSLHLFANDNDTMYISVERTFIKTGTGFFSRKVAELSYGQEVIVISEKGNHLQVSIAENESIVGWLPKSSATSKKIVLRDNKAVSTSAEELALAGKGFNQEVEDFIVQQDGISFEAVDALEMNTIDEDSLQNFILEGSLNGVEE